MSPPLPFRNRSSASKGLTNIPWYTAILRVKISTRSELATIWFLPTSLTLLPMTSHLCGPAVMFFLPLVHAGVSPSQGLCSSRRLYPRNSSLSFMPIKSSSTSNLSFSTHEDPSHLQLVPILHDTPLCIINSCSLLPFTFSHMFIMLTAFFHTRL